MANNAKKTYEALLISGTKKGGGSSTAGGSAATGGGLVSQMRSNLGALPASGVIVGTVSASPANPTPAQPSGPYIDIANDYEARARANLAAQEAQMRQQLLASQNASNRQYEGAANANYLNYMRQRNALPEQLAAQHINGGASETANMNMMNNYALTRGNTEASRIAALAQLQSTHDTNLANMRSAAEDNILNNRTALRQAQIQYDDTLAQRELENKRYAEEVARQQQQYKDEQKWKKKEYKTEQKWKKKEYKDTKKSKVLEQYAATISRYTSDESIDKAIKKLKKTKPANYKQMIWLLQQRKAELNQQ